MNAGLLYRTGTIEGASPVALVARLYEQMIEDLRQAIKALAENDIELRTDRINHAILVTGFLESQLNFEAGGKVAETLKNFYTSLRAKMLEAQILQSKAVMTQLITDLLAVREAWIGVEQDQKSTAATNQAASKLPESDTAIRRTDWNG
jgi:flagellar biosynthetic protein FliS